MFWQLFDAAPVGGVTVHLVDPAEDHGPIVRQQAFPLAPGTSLAELLARVIEIGPPLLLEAVDGILNGSIRPIPQPASSPTRRARRLRREDRDLISWEQWSLERTWQVLRGTGPFLGWPRARWRDLGWTPVIEGMTADISGLPVGAVGRDAGGRFLAHPGGRIRFRYRWAPRAWLAAMGRGGAPVGGIISSEKAAWPPLERVLPSWPYRRQRRPPDAVTLRPRR